jgi:hypothetical protein
MKVKTNLKAGKGIRNAWRNGGNVVRHFEQSATPVLMKVKNTLTNPKFWTWPF